MTSIDQTEDKYVKLIYRRIIILASAAHFSYIVIFVLTGVYPLAVYNIASVCFYLAMGQSVERGYYRMAVTCVHFEVCVFAVVCTLSAGWDIGISPYLIAMTSLTYFCPFKHKYVPYLFAGFEICVFLALRLYTGFACPDFLAVSEKEALWISIFSICACFTIILYAAVSSKLSAAVSRQELQDENRSLSTLANYDQLTGLLSRHAFLKRAEHCQASSAVLVLSDIDDFKVVNDTWGHSCGDKILSETAELIRSFLGGNVDVCRWGGEEFVFLFRDTPLKDVLVKLQELCDTVAGHNFCCDDKKLHITMTFGVSPSGEGASPEEIIALADRQMYKGKTEGKNRVVCGKP